MGNISRWPQVVPEDGWFNFNLDTSDRDDPGLHSARARRFQLTGGFQLLVGQDIHELKSAQRRMITALSWGVVLTVLLGLAGGFFISRRMLARLEVINETSQRIIAGELGRRVPVSSRQDEFDRLSANLNQMLDQIQELMDGIRQGSDNIAHDLKTPLFHLRQKLESLTSQASSDAGSSKELHDALAEADRLLNLFNALLRIARLESESARTIKQSLSLPDLVHDVAELYEPLSDEKHQVLSVNVQSPVSILADRDMLFQALANLVDNAVKYTPEGGNIRLTITAEALWRYKCLRQRSRDCIDRKGKSFSALLSHRCQPLYSGQWAGLESGASGNPLTQWNTYPTGQPSRTLCPSIPTP